MHVDDLADLFLLAIDRAPPGVILHGVGGGAVAVMEIAAAADRAASGTDRADAWPATSAAVEIGEQYATWLAPAQEIRSARTREALG